MARQKNGPGNGSGELDEAEAAAGHDEAGETDGDGGTGNERPVTGAFRGRQRPLWEAPVETGFNGYRGSGG